jgi:glycosyltransferase involved in cell wall biosynthesis
MISVQKHMQITATILARNEQDIIGENIEHHINQGVTNFIVTLNQCTDRTKEIVERYPEVVEIIEEPGNDHHQSKWVSRMAQIANKLKPEWIIHLDADEFWCGLYKLRLFNCPVVASDRMFLHPPVKDMVCFDPVMMRFYLNWESSNLPGETKVAHRPLENPTITHGNHGVEGANAVFTRMVYRHHYPIRTYKQFERKTIEGHEALMRRNAPCPRWELWYRAWKAGDLPKLYDSITSTWEKIIAEPSIPRVIDLLEVWSTPDTIQYLTKAFVVPQVGNWCP